MGKLCWGSCKIKIKEKQGKQAITDLPDEQKEISGVSVSDTLLISATKQGS